ncbi:MULTISPECIES: hypothetical protein [Mycolicibacterium]|uniref:hypothetical protein n=1 Tax=Mycolicibacterium TaxID=1866885 RepID=UPI00103C1BDA|nr:hypothetical protein [Mycolicibacterium chlorophenolicum]
MADIQPDRIDPDAAFGAAPSSGASELGSLQIEDPGQPNFSRAVDVSRLARRAEDCGVSLVEGEMQDVAGFKPFRRERQDC